MNTITIPYSLHTLQVEWLCQCNRHLASFEERHNRDLSDHNIRLKSITAHVQCLKAHLRRATFCLYVIIYKVPGSKCSLAVYFVMFYSKEIVMELHSLIAAIPVWFEIDFHSLIVAIPVGFKIGFFSLIAAILVGFETDFLWQGLIIIFGYNRLASLSVMIPHSELCFICSIHVEKWAFIHQQIK